MMMDSNHTNNTGQRKDLCHEEGEFYNPTDDENVEIRLLAAHTNFTIAVLIFIIFAVGVTGNVIFLLSVIRVKALKTVTNFYLANVAVADLLFLHLETSHAIWEYKEKASPLTTNVGCGLFYFTYYLSFFASILLITLVTLERYFAICHPLKHRQMNNKKRSVILTIITWFVAAVFAVLVSLRFGKLKKLCILYAPTECINENDFDNFTLNSPIHSTFRDLADIDLGVSFFVTECTNGYDYDYDYDFDDNFTLCSPIHSTLQDLADIIQDISFYTTECKNENDTSFDNFTLCSPIHSTLQNLADIVQGIPFFMTKCTNKNDTDFDDNFTLCSPIHSTLQDLAYIVQDISFFMTECTNENDTNFDNFTLCSPIHPKLRDLADIVQGIPFFVAAVINTILYIKIIKRLYKAAPHAPKQRRRHLQKQQTMKQKRRIAHMLLANFIIFFVCLAPGQF